MPEVRDLPRTANANLQEKRMLHSHGSWCVHMYTKDLACSIYCQWGKNNWPTERDYLFDLYFGSNSRWI